MYATHAYKTDENSIEYKIVCNRNRRLKPESVNSVGPGKGLLIPVLLQHGPPTHLLENVFEGVQPDLLNHVFVHARRVNVPVHRLKVFIQ